MLGEDEECTDPRSFPSKAPLARFAVIIAGALMNFALGILLILLLLSMTGFATNKAAYLSPELPAYKAGIREGDRIVAINGSRTNIFEDVIFAMNFPRGEEVRVETISNGERKTYNIIPETLEYTNNGKSFSRYIIGVAPESYGGFLSADENSARAPFGEYIKNSLWHFGFYVNTTIKSLFMLITGQVGLSELSGIIGIGGVFVDSIGDPINAVGEAGVTMPFALRFWAAVTNVLTIMTLLTINLGIMNLLPFPALDGGRGLFILIEAARRKPLDQNREGAIHFAGFVLLMILMVVITYNDILKVFTRG
jgi:regulator of sigma E protease